MQKEDICSYCKSINSLRVDHPHGEIVCTKCRVVVEDHLIEEIGTWDKTNVDGQLGGLRDNYAQDSGLNTKIIPKGKGHAQLSALHMKSTSESGDKSLYRGSQLLINFGELLHLPSIVIDHCKNTLRKVIKDKKLKGRNLEALVVTILYVTAKAKGNPRNLKDVISKTQVVKKEMLRCIKLVNRFTSKDKCDVDDGIVEHICNRINLNNNIRAKAKQVLKNVLSKGILTGKNPYTVAGVAVLLVSKSLNPKVKESEIANTISLSESTVKNALKDIWSSRFDILPRELASNPVYKS